MFPVVLAQSNAMTGFFPRILHTHRPGARSIVLISDIEMAEPGPVDPFPRDDFLADLFEAYTKPPYDGVPVDLVLNGDVFDLVKVPYQGEFCRHITAEIALAKLDIVLDGHPSFVEGLRRFGAHPSGNKRIHFITGNHDPELSFPEVQQRLRERLDGVAEVHFPGFQTRIGPVHIEHGQQFDDAFAQDPDNLFLGWNDQTILNIPWCTVAVMEAAFPLSAIFFPYENLRPRSLMFERFPLVHEVLANAFKRYWAREFLPGALKRGDPTRKITWSMIRQIIQRTRDNDVDAGVRESDIINLFTGDSSIQVAAFGHLHRPIWRMVGTRYVLRTGCMRDEFEIFRDNDRVIGIPKSYGEIVLNGDDVEDTRLFHVPSPAPPPDDLFTMTDRMKAAAEALRPQRRRKRRRDADPFDLEPSSDDASLEESDAQP